jgi:hypothetical protein
VSGVLLKKKYEEVKQKVLGKLSKEKYIHLTIDLWSNRQMRSFLGITAHYISDQWLLESAMLGCSRVIGRHTSDNIVHWYEEIVADFGVSLKVRHVVTDSGANIKKAFQSLALPGFEEEASSDSEEEDDDHNSFTTCTAHETIESGSGYVSPSTSPLFCTYLAISCQGRVSQGRLHWDCNQEVF